ncbi:hypothetical protein [Paenibacillus glycinis]|uniref:Phenylalanyl-tRNA synthetase subunit beta n=1 Tax=Paenibacillus glycinis TaxID=2697035 RepID=A0ABW9XXZ3_9BACL|nr:hypothetical protein [Paenibacillus glycinis]NBD27575.1 hypothetical protein [Paenibacillus glycinis]
MKKWIMVLILAAGIGFAGYKYVYHAVGNKIMEQVADEVLNAKETTEMLADPEVKQMIQSSLDAEDVKHLLGEQAVAEDRAGTDKQGHSSPKKMAVKNKNEAIKLVMDKFSIGELKDMAAKVKGGMTGQEKAELKQRVSERFSEDELDSLKIIALMEAEKH